MIIDSPIISGSYLSTGSLSQTGNVSITGSLTATGGISGSFSGSGANLFDIPAAGIVGLNLSQIASGSVSASISPNQGLLINTSVSASNFTGSFTGSLTGIATSASYAAFALTSSYSLGGSGFPFSGSAVITGSLIVSGSGLTITGSVAISTLTTGSGVRYVIADADGLISAQTASAVIFTTQQTIATAGQTVFPITNGYSTGYVTVFVNGSKLNDDEFTDTSGTNIVFATGSMVNDVVEFQKYLPASGVSNNTLRTTNYFTTTLGQTNFTVNYTPGLLDVFYNGSKLSNTEYTAANGTSILLATGSNAGDTLEVDVYSYQVGAFSGIGGSGVARELAFYNTSNSITGSNKVTYDGSTFSVTGSFLVTGSSTFTNIGPAIFSGSVTAVGGFTGSFSGNADSASLAQNSLLLQGTGSVGFTTTASFLAVSSSQQQISASQQQLSSSFLTLTASFNAVSASQQQISASLLNVISIFATTGSNSFRETQSITGSLTVTGQIIAQSINVQQVTSSIVYSSGSNVFGCDLNSRQTFTGSVLITGSLTIAGASSAASYSGATIYGSTIACSPIGCFATSCATSFIGGTMSGTTIYGSTVACSPIGLFSGCVGIGTANPSAKLHINGGRTLAITGNENYSLGIGRESNTNAYYLGVHSTSSPNLLFSNNAGTTNMTLDYSGNLGLGVTPSAWRNLFTAFQVGYTGALYSTTVSTAGEQVNLASNYYQDSAGNELRIQAGYATRYQQASGQHIWSTAGTSSAGSGITFTQAMTLTAAGNLGLNFTPSATGTNARALQLTNYGTISGNGNIGSISLAANAYESADNCWNRVNATSAGLYQISYTGQHTWSYTGASTANSAITWTQAMLLNSSGNLGIGVTPSVWSLGKAIEIGNLGHAIWSVNATQYNIMYNAYYNGGFVYASSNPASYYQQASGAHTWYNAPSGTIGCAITFCPAMALNACSRLLVGSGVTDSGASIQTNGDIRANYDSSIFLQINGGAAGDYRKGFSGINQETGVARGLHIFNYDPDSSQGIKFFGGTFAARARFGGFDSGGNFFVNATDSAEGYKFYVNGTAAINSTLQVNGAANFASVVCAPNFTTSGANSSIRGGDPAFFRGTSVIQSGNSITFDAFRFLNPSGGTGGASSSISGKLYMTFQDTSTGGNQVSYEYLIFTTGNGVSPGPYCFAQLYCGPVRGTNPISSISLVNDGSGGAAKVQATTAASGVAGAIAYITFVGTAV